MKRKALGRGLAALIPEVAPSKERLLEIDLDLIDPNPFQPRTPGNRGDIEGLVASIRENGIVQPILVRPQNSRYQLIAGERRWLASQQAGLFKIPAVVREVADDQLLEYALVENIQRQELTPIEEAQAYKRLMQDLGMTQEGVAQKVGKDRASVANTLRLLKLPASIKDWVHEGKLSMGHARAMLALESERQQMQVARQIVARDLSVRGVEELVKRISGSHSTRTQKSKESDPNVAAVISQLRQRLGTKVEILGRAKRGKIVIHYYSEEDLQRLFERLAGRGS